MQARLKLSAWFTAPVFLTAMADMIPGVSLDAIIPARALGGFQLLFTSLVLFGPGREFLARGWRGAASGRANMFTLIGLGALVAYLYSVVAACLPGLLPAAQAGPGGRVPVYFESTAVIITLTALGQVLELRARRRTGDAIRALMKLQPETARRIGADGSENDTAIAAVRPGDRLRIRPGERIPVDGVAVEGSSAVDESMVTGEPVPAAKQPGAPLTAGTVNGSGALVMEAQRVGGDTLLARIVRLVEQARQTRAPVQRVADTVAAWFVPAVVAAAAVTFVVWMLAGPPGALQYAVVSAVAVLIIACPCVLGLATPVSLTVGLGRGASRGVLIKDAVALEVLAKVDTLVVDKTGTLTRGKPQLTAMHTTDPASPADPAHPENTEDADRLLAACAGLEQASEHPLAAATVEAARARGLPLPAASEVEVAPGRGIAGRVGGREIRLGTADHLSAAGVDIAALESAASDLRAGGATLAFVAADGRPAGVLAFTDPVKETTPAALAFLRAERVRVVMATGDHETSARHVARALGITDVHAGLSPEAKVELVRTLRAEGREVAMAGDGINDAPALAAAQVGIAMGAGTDVAMESAGVTLVHGDLGAIAAARRLSRATLANIRQNLAWAFGYNGLCIPLAAGVLYPATGWLLDPMIAALAMSLSCVTIMVNALRLRHARI